MPVAAITLPLPQQDRRGAEPNLDTPAELPPGRVSFGDELGRETALRARSTRDEVDAESPPAAARTEPRGDATDDPASGDPGSEPDATALAMAASTTLASAAPQAPQLELEPGDALLATLEDDPIESLASDATLAGYDADTDAELSTLLDDPARGDATHTTPFEAASDPTMPDLVASTDFVEIADLADPAALAAEPADHDSLANALDLEAVAPPTPVEGADSRSLHVAATLERNATPEPTPAAVPAERVASHEDQVERIVRLVALRDLPRALASEVDGFLRMRGRGRHWDAEIRLDPPELGALHVRLELRGESIHAVVRAEDPRLESQLDGLLKDLEQQLQKQGNQASFDLRRGTGQDGEGPRSTRVDRTEIRGAERVVRPGAAGRSSDRLVDLLA